MRPQARGSVIKGRSQFQLIVIALFSAGLLGGFLYHRQPAVGHKESFHTAIESTGGNANRRELHLGSAGHQATASQSSSSSLSSLANTQQQVPDAPQGEVASPSPQVLVNANDARHPDNVRAILKGQSHGEEQRQSMLQSFIKGRFEGWTLNGKNKGAATDKQSAGVKQTGSGKGVQGGGAVGSKGAVTGGKTAGAGAGVASGTHTAETVKGVAGSGGRGSTATGTKAAGSGISSPANGSPAASTMAADSGTSSPATVTKAAGSTRVATGGPGTSAPGPGCAKPGAGCGLPGGTIHTLFTSNGSPYQNFQARIMIATWKLARAQPGGAHMVAMTRILHRTTPDELMDEVDTFRADPLQPECDKWCWFPVADRANAFQQWLDATERQPDMQKAPWLLLLETDYVWIKPLQVMGDAYDPKVPGLSFAFDYIGPRNNKYVEQMLKEECPTCDPATVPNSGPAPVLARFEDFKAATPLWEKLSKWIETHEDAKKALGWVREMYAWDIGVAAGRLNILNQGPPTTTLIAQPPHDLRPYNASMYHYTWGSIFRDENNTDIWKFDKRAYVDPKDALKVPHIPLPPPWRAGLKLHDGVPISKDLQDTLTHMLTLMNKGIDTLPDLTQHAALLKKKQIEAEEQAKKDAASKAVAAATS